MLKALVLALALTQTAEFEVASIRPSPQPTADQRGFGLETGTRIGQSRVQLQSITLKDAIALAYRQNRDRIVGPDWLTATRFDIAATLPPGVRRQDVPDMLQALLADRFRLRVHTER